MAVMTVIEHLQNRLKPGDLFRVEYGKRLYQVGGAAEKLNDALRDSCILPIIKDCNVTSSEWTVAGNNKWRLVLRVRATPSLTEKVRASFGD